MMSFSIYKATNTINGKSYSESHKYNLSVSHKCHIVSLETKIKTSNALKGILKGPQMKVVCEHCGISGGISVMKRWHGDNCKHKNMQKINNNT